MPHTSNVRLHIIQVRASGLGQTSRQDLLPTGVQLLEPVVPMGTASSFVVTDQQPQLHLTPGGSHFPRAVNNVRLSHVPTASSQ